MKIPIGEIHIGERRREDLGDIETLARVLSSMGSSSPGRGSRRQPNRRGTKAPCSSVVGVDRDRSARV